MSSIAYWLISDMQDDGKLLQRPPRNTITYYFAKCNGTRWKMIQSFQTHEFGGPFTLDTFPSFGNPVVILNPAANRGKMDKHRAVVRVRAQSEQARYIETTKQGEAKELAMAAAKQGHPVIIAG